MRPMRPTVLTLLFAALVGQASFAPALAQAGQEQSRPVHGINPADMDPAADPRQDFYRFANGGWLDRTEIPADEGQYSFFNELQDETTAQLLDLLGRLGAGGTLQGGTDEWKAVRLFEQGTDLATRNDQGIDPVRPTLDEIDAIADLTGYHRFLEGATFRGVDGLFSIVAAPKLTDATTMGAFVDGPYLGLPNRDYYLEDAAGNEEVRAAHRAAAAELLTLIGYDPTRAGAAAQAVYDLERTLAELTLTREEQQNASALNNPTPVDQLPSIYPLMDWSRYLAALGLGDVAEVNVLELRYLRALPGVVERTPIAALKDYLKLQVLWTFRLSLSAEVEETWFDRNRLLTGLEELPPLEERSLYQVNELLGDAVGQLYVAQAFPPEAKVRITELAEAVKVAFGERLDANTWMSPETKAKAQEKLDKLGLKVGYPDRWLSYGAVTIEASYAASVLSATNAERRRTLDQIGKPVDRGDWTLLGFGPVPPQTINAFYSPQANEIVFPAAILQPPLFDYRADPASNFGAIGFFIGHEITHGFDLVGSQFDADGNLANWWTPEDYERFQALNDRVVRQYGAIEVLPGLNVNGQVSVTENVADLGGVQVAYDALGYHLATRGQPPALVEASPVASPLVDTAATPAATPVGSPAAVAAVAAVEELTPEQRFFVAAATVWRDETRDELLETVVKTDTHAPAAIRATQPIRNMDAFHEAFGTRPGDAMYLPPEERVVVW